MNRFIQKRASATPPKSVVLFSTDDSESGTTSGCTSMVSALDFHNIAHSAIVIPKTGYEGSFPLTASDGSPQYSLLVFCVIGASYYYGNNTGWQSAITQSQNAQLNDYQAQFNVRRVSFNVYPSANLGVSLANPAAPGCCGGDINQPMSWYPDGVVNGLGINASSVTNPSVLSTTGLYHYPAVVNITSSFEGTTVQPFLKFAPLPPDYANENVAAVVIKSTTSEHMVYFATFASWSPTSAYLGDAWIQWGLRNVSYTGYGRHVEASKVADLPLANLKSSATPTYGTIPLFALMTALLLFQIFRLTARKL